MAGPAQLATQVARPAREVEDARPGRQVQLADRAASPADVHAERHHPVHEVVARPDPVEQ